MRGIALVTALCLMAAPARATIWSCRMDSAQETARSEPSRPLIRGLDNSVLVALGGIAVILLIGSHYLPAFLSPGYLVLQLRIAAFLGIVAAWQMVVILLGHRPVDSVDRDGIGDDGDDAGRDGRTMSPAA